jgi:hypothetical protein
MSATKPFFISTKEISLFDSMNEELIDEFVGQSVDIYKINTEHTKGNIYGESTTKYFNVGFRVNCLIRYNAPEVEQFESVGADVNSTIEMNFQRNNLASGSLNFYLHLIYYVHQFHRGLSSICNDDNLLRCADAFIA